MYGGTYILILKCVEGRPRRAAMNCQFGINLASCYIVFDFLAPELGISQWRREIFFGK